MAETLYFECLEGQLPFTETVKTIEKARAWWIWNVVLNEPCLRCLPKSSVNVNNSLVYTFFCSLILTRNRVEFSFLFCYTHCSGNIDEPEPSFQPVPTFLHQKIAITR